MRELENPKSHQQQIQNALNYFLDNITRCHETIKIFPTTGEIFFVYFVWIMKDKKIE